METPAPLTGRRVDRAKRPQREIGFMKFVSFKSRGGDYLVIVQNVAWLRSHEDGQTKVGIIGSDAILVAGTIEETAASILEG
jgi:hypothetical protein